MTQEMKGLLLEDRWAPVTSTMGFLELGAEQAAQAFATWQRELMTPRGITVEVLPVTGTLEQALSSLLPLTGGEMQRRPVHPDAQRLDRLRHQPVDRDGCRQPHALHGPEAEHPVPAGGRRAPHAAQGPRRRYGAVMLDVFGPEQPGKIRNTVRALGAANDGGRWVFEQSGEPFPFEQVEQYQARRVRDRFTFEMLKDYLRHLGLAPFEEDFYLPPGSCAWLVQKTGPFYHRRAGVHAGGGPRRPRVVTHPGRMGSTCHLRTATNRSVQPGRFLHRTARAQVLVPGLQVGGAIPGVMRLHVPGGGGPARGGLPERPHRGLLVERRTAQLDELLEQRGVQALLVDGRAHEEHHRLAQLLGRARQRAGPLPSAVCRSNRPSPVSTTSASATRRSAGASWATSRYPETMLPSRQRREPVPEAPRPRPRPAPGRARARAPGRTGPARPPARSTVPRPRPSAARRGARRHPGPAAAR